MKTLDKINAVVAFVWFISGSAVDSESWIPLIVCAICTLWLGLFLKVPEGGDRNALD